MTARFHSRHSAYYLLALMAFAMEMVFGWRASVMYEHFLAPYVGFWELVGFRLVVFLGVAVGGYVLATHRQFGLEAITDRIKKRGLVRKFELGKISWAEYSVYGGVIVIIIHDWAGVIYTVFGESVTAPINMVTIAVTVGMCAFCLLPFLLGHMMLALAESITAEREEAFDRKIDTLDKQVRIQAAKELADNASDLSPEDRLRKGVRGYIAEKTQDASPKYEALPKYQANAQSASLNQDGKR